MGKTPKKGPALRGRAGKMIAKHKRQVSRHQTSRGGELVASADWFGNVYVWDVWEKEAKATFEKVHAERAQAASFFHEDARLVSGGFDGAIRVWDLESQEQLQEHVFPEGWVWDVHVSDDERWLLANVELEKREGSTFHVWPMADGVVDFDAERVFAHEVGFIPAHTDALWRYVRESGDVSFLSLTDDRHSPGPDFSGHPSMLSFSGDGSRFVVLTGREEGRFLEVRDFPSLELVASIPSAIRFSEYPVLSPDGSLVAAFQFENVCVWDVETGTQWMPENAKHTDTPSALSFATGGTTLVTSGWDKSLRFWDLQGYLHQMQNP